MFQRFRGDLTRRVQGLTNRERLNRLLLLFILRPNGQADEERYIELVRAELDRRDGRPRKQLVIGYRRGSPTLCTGGFLGPIPGSQSLTLPTMRVTQVPPTH